MSFEHKHDGAEPSCVRNVRYSVVSEEPLATSVTGTTTVFQQLPLSDEAPQLIQQASSTPAVDGQIFSDELCSARIDPAQLLECSTCKSYPKTAIAAINSDEQSAEETVKERLIFLSKLFLKQYHFSSSFEVLALCSQRH